MFLSPGLTFAASMGVIGSAMAAGFWDRRNGRILHLCYPRGPRRRRISECDAEAMVDHLQQWKSGPGCGAAFSAELRLGFVQPVRAGIATLARLCAGRTADGGRDPVHHGSLAASQ
ncbi:hypothetical protein G7054_g3528 [Neopestalotiopsis clavispora]|nr:hypothetical protein G7054_g3528 [Neopestalotiopsis clavispora]